MDKRSLKNDLHTSNFVVILNILFKSPFYALKSTLKLSLLNLSIHLHNNLAPRDNLQMY